MRLLAIRDEISLHDFSCHGVIHAQNVGDRVGPVLFIQAGFEQASQNNGITKLDLIQDLNFDSKQQHRTMRI